MQESKQNPKPKPKPPKTLGTFQVQSRHGNGPSSTFVHCNSPDPYVPYRSPYKCPVAVNQSLNLHLGLPFNPRNITFVRILCHFLSRIFQCIELYFFQAWESIPLGKRQYVTVKAWSLYLPLHRFLFKNKTAIHQNASYEYHALSTIMYWGRMFPASIPRIRFSLSQLAVWHGANVYPKTSLPVRGVEEVGVGVSRSSGPHQEEDMGGKEQPEPEEEEQNCITVEKVHLDGNDGQQTDTESILDALSQRESNRGISGYYLHNPQAKGKVLFYLYGGAFLGGDAKGNVHYGIKLSQQCNMDVFIPQYGLLPEYHFLDALEDVIRAYVYLIETRRGGIHPKNVILFGISSGGGLMVRLLQRIVKQQQQQQVGKTSKNNNIIEHMNGCDGHEEEENDHHEHEDDFLLQVVPSGAVLMSPFVDYTTPKGSFKEYTVHDLIVNEVS
jgi:Esterase/lipase